MSQPEPFSLALAADMPAAEREALLQTLRPYAQVQDLQSKSLDLATVVVIIAAIGTAAGAAKNLIEVGEKIAGWVKQLRERGETPNARLERPGQPTLDLSTASDEEILTWLLQEKITR